MLSQILSHEPKLAVANHGVFTRQEKWSAAYNVRTVLLSIQSLLGGKEANLLDRIPS